MKNMYYTPHFLTIRLFVLSFLVLLISPMPALSTQDEEDSFEGTSCFSYSESTTPKEKIHLKTDLASSDKKRKWSEVEEEKRASFSTNKFVKITESASVNNASFKEEQYFPDKVLTLVLPFLDSQGSLKVSQVCHRWRSVSADAIRTDRSPLNLRALPLLSQENFSNLLSHKNTSEKGGIFLSLGGEKIKTSSLFGYKENSFPYLCSLSLLKSKICIEELQGLKNFFPNLTLLDLSRNKIAGVEILFVLSVSPHLTSLYLGRNKLGDVGLQTISLLKYPSLTLLDIPYNHITNDGLKYFNLNSHITTLNLGGNTDITSVEKIQDLSKNPLKKLNLSETHLSNGTVYNRLPSGLTHLNLNGVGLKARHSQDLVIKLPNLICLTLQSNTIGNKGLCSLVNQLASLTSLDAQDNNITKKVLLEFKLKNQTLRFLDLRNNFDDSLGEDEIKGLIGNPLFKNCLPNLGTLYLEEEKNVLSKTSHQT